MIDKAIRIIERFSDLSGKIVSYLILFITVIIIYEIAARYIFNSPTMWVAETSEFAFALFFLLGGAYTLYYDGHVKIDIILSRITKKSRNILELIAAIIIVSYMALFSWTSGIMAYESTMLMERSQSVWGPYIFPIFWAVPIAGVMMILQAASDAIKCLKAIKAGA